MRASEVAAAVGGELFGATRRRRSGDRQSRAPCAGRAVRADRRRARRPRLHRRRGRRRAPRAYLTAGPIAAATAVRVDDTAAALLALGRHARTRLADPSRRHHRQRRQDIDEGPARRRCCARPIARRPASAPSTTSSACRSHWPTHPTAPKRRVIEMGARGIGHIARAVRGRAADGRRRDGGGRRPPRAVRLARGGGAGQRASWSRRLPDDGLRGAQRRRSAGRRHGRHGPRPASSRSAVGGRGARGRRGASTTSSALVPAAHAMGGQPTSGSACAGRHQVVNALAAAAAALAVGVPLEPWPPGWPRASCRHAHGARDRPAGAPGPQRRLQRQPGVDGGALDALAALPAQRRIAVLGTMAELGPAGAAEHAAIARPRGAAGHPRHRHRRTCVRDRRTGRRGFDRRAVERLGRSSARATPCW